MGDVASGQGIRRSRGSPACWVLAVFCDPLEGGGREKRDGGVGGETATGQTTALVGRAKGETGRASIARATSQRLSKRSLDVEASGRGDRAAFRGAAPSGARVEDPAFLWLELPEANATGQGEEGKGD